MYLRCRNLRWDIQSTEKRLPPIDEEMCYHNASRNSYDWYLPQSLHWTDHEAISLYAMFVIAGSRQFKRSSSLRVFDVWNVPENLHWNVVHRSAPYISVATIPNGLVSYLFRHFWTVLNIHYMRVHVDASFWNVWNLWQVISTYSRAPDLECKPLKYYISWHYDHFKLHTN